MSVTTESNKGNGGIIWQLMRGETGDTSCTIAASYVSAYRQLINLPGQQREAVIREIRNAIKAAKER